MAKGWRHLLVPLVAGLEVLVLTSVAGTGLAHSLAAEPFLSRGPQSSVLSLFLAIALQRLFECYQMGDRRFNCHCEHEPSRRSNSLFRRHYVPWLRSLRRRKRMRRCRSMRRQRTKGCPRSSALRRRKALSITTNNAGGSGPLAELHCRIDTPVGEFNFCNQHQDPCPQKYSEDRIEHVLPSTPPGKHHNDLAEFCPGDLCVYLQHSPESCAGHKCREAQVYFFVPKIRIH